MLKYLHMLFCIMMFGNTPANIDKVEISVSQQKVEKVITVPFELSDSGGIIIPVNIDGVRVGCMLDTGCNGFLIPDDVKVEASFTGYTTTYINSVTGAFETLEATVKNVNIGEYHLDSLACAITLNRSSSKNRSKSYPLLGLSAFAGKAVSIDYVKREISIYPGGSINIFLNDRKSYLRCKWIQADKSEIGSSVVGGSLADTPVRILLDTGDGGMTSISDFLFEKLKQKGYKSQGTVSVNNQSFPFIPLVEFHMEKYKHIQFSTTAYVFPKSQYGEENVLPFDIIVGRPLLRNFLLYFDTTTKEICLVPYSLSKVETNSDGKQITKYTYIDEFVRSGPPFKAPKGWHWEIMRTQTNEDDYVLKINPLKE